MAAILVVEDDGLVARQIARTLRAAGHAPVLASDARAALQECRQGPDMILLDLGLPDLPGEALLGRLKQQPETAAVPVVVITGKREAAAQLRETVKGGVTEILLKPVSGAQLRQAVNAALEGLEESDADALRRTQERQRRIIKHLLVAGSDALALQVGRRLSLDRARGGRPSRMEALTWSEIAAWARHEGVVDIEQAKLLRRISSSASREVRQDAV